NGHLFRHRMTHPPQLMDCPERHFVVGDKDCRRRFGQIEQGMAEILTGAQKVVTALYITVGDGQSCLRHGAPIPFEAICSHNLRQRSCYMGYAAMSKGDEMARGFPSGRL